MGKNKHRLAIYMWLVDDYAASFSVVTDKSIKDYTDFIWSKPYFRLCYPDKVLSINTSRIIRVEVKETDDVEIKQM